MASRYYALAMVLASLLTQGAFAQAADNKTPLARILSDWHERQGLVKTARYVVTGTEESKESRLPPGNPVRPLRYVLLLDFEHHRYRQESSEPRVRGGVEGGLSPGAEYYSFIHTSAFDSKTLQSLYHREVNRLPKDTPDLGIDKGESWGPGFQFGPNLAPVFFAHGLVQTVHANVQPDRLSMTYDPDEFEMRGRQIFNGRTCTVVRTEPVPTMAPSYDELWIDQNQKGAIHRHVNFVGPDPSYRFDVEWKQTELGWWPTNWTSTWTMDGKVMRISRLRIESFEPNVMVADSDFTFQAEPGMKVRVSESAPAGKGLNPNFAATTMYLISPSGAWQETSATGFTTIDGKVLPPERGRAWVWWVGAAAAAVGAAVFAYYFARRRRRRAA